MNNNALNLLSVFNENKIKILFSVYLCQNDICNCDLADKLDIQKNLVSYHIKSLKEIGLVEEAKCGKRKRYKIPENKLEKVKNILKVLELI